jgi:hypothetical protein
MSRDLQNENRLLKQQLKLSNTLKSREDLNGMFNNSDLTSRMALQSQITKTHNDKRNLYKVFGYDIEPTIADYINRFLRQDIAKRIVEAYPKACWGEQPIITDDNDTQEETIFETEVLSLVTDRKIKLFHYIQRLDIVAGLGHYGVLFIGVRDGKNPKDPLVSRIRKEDILFMSAYSEKNVSISEYDQDPQSERYGLPTFYKLTAGGYGGNNTYSPSAMMSREVIEVHHSRIIHVAEGVLENDVFGTPRLEPVVNRLIDLEKIVGGGSEMFFLNARGGLHMNQQPETKLVDTALLETRMEEFTHNLTRYLRTKGIDVNTLNFDIADPQNYFNMIISLISATTGIPKRILTGSEQGQLASSQDENNWLSRIMERQKDYCEFQILRPIIDWFILNGVLSKPKTDDYKIQWKDLQTVSDIDKAEVAVKTTQAVANYVNAQGAEMIMPPEQLFEDVLGLEYRESDLPDADDFDDIDDENTDDVEEES